MPVSEVCEAPPASGPWRPDVSFCGCRRQEREELIQEWSPEPLVPEDADQKPVKYDIVQGKVRGRCLSASYQACRASGKQEILDRFKP